MCRGRRFLRPFSSKRHPSGCRTDERTGAPVEDEDKQSAALSSGCMSLKGFVWLYGLKLFAYSGYLCLYQMFALL